MLASGNGNKQTCVNNLLSIIRGEVPYDRLRGLDARIIDKPGGEADDELRQDAVWVLETYEPRAEVQQIQVTHDDAANGQFSVSAQIS